MGVEEKLKMKRCIKKVYSVCRQCGPILEVLLKVLMIILRVAVKLFVIGLKVMAYPVSSAFRWIDSLFTTQQTHTMYVIRYKN